MGLQHQKKKKEGILQPFTRKDCVMYSLKEHISEFPVVAGRKCAPASLASVKMTTARQKAFRANIKALNLLSLRAFGINSSKTQAICSKRNPQVTPVFEIKMWNASASCFFLDMINLYSAFFFFNSSSFLMHTV